MEDTSASVTVDESSITRSRNSRRATNNVIRFDIETYGSGGEGSSDDRESDGFYDEFSPTNKSNKQKDSKKRQRNGGEEPKKKRQKITHKSTPSYPSAASSSHLPSHGRSWTQEEKDKFISGLEIHGRGKWVQIADYIQTRNA